MKYRNLIIVALGMLSMACQREDAELQQKGSGTQMMLATRAGGNGDPVFTNGDKLGMYVAVAGTELKAEGNLYSNVCLTREDGLWTGTAMYYPNASAVDVYNYSPWQQTAVDVSALNVAVATDQAAEGAYRKSDFLWAKTASQAKGSDGLEIVMKHRMSKAEISLTAGNGVTEDYLKTVTGVKLQNLRTATVVNLSTGEVALAPGAPVADVTPAKAGELLWMAIVAPQTLAAGTPAIELTFSDGTKRLFKPENDITYQAGKVKRFNITLNNESIAVGVVTVEEWTADGDIVEGEAKIEISTPQIGGSDGATGSHFAKGDKLGLFFFAGNSVMANGGNVLYTAAEDGALSSATTLYYPSENAVTIYAYAPYRETVAGTDINFSVSDNQQMAANKAASDLVVAKAEGLKNGAPAAGLVFRHAMSQVVVNLKKGNGITDAEFANATVNFLNVMRGTKMNLKTGECLQSSDKGKVVPYSDKAAFTAVLVPQKLVATEKFLEISLGGSATWVYKTGMELKSGSRYTLNVTVSNLGISVGTPVIADWTDETAVEDEADKIDRGNVPGDELAQVPPVSNGGLAIPDCSFAPSDNIINVNIPGIKDGTDYVDLSGTATGKTNVWVTVDGVEKGCYVVPKGDTDQEKMKLDIVFLVDNSSTMGDEAENIAKGIKEWYSHLAAQQNLDIQVGSVGFAYSYDNYKSIQSLNIGTGVSGALDLTGGNELDSYLNNRTLLDGNPAIKQQRTQGFAGGNAADLLEKARKLNALAAPSSGECVMIALKYADQYFNWRKGAGRVYVVFTDTYNFATKAGYRVSDINQTFNGTVYTVWSNEDFGLNTFIDGISASENPAWLSVRTGAVLEADVAKTGNGGVLRIKTDASDLDLINNFDVTKAALNAKIVQFFYENIDVTPGKHTVKLTFQNGSKVGSRIFENVMF